MINEEFSERIGENKLFLNIPHRKSNSIGHILRRNCLLHDATEGENTGVKGGGRRITKLIYDLKYKIRYWDITHTTTYKIKLCRTYIQHSSYIHRHRNKPRNSTHTTKRPQTKHH